MVVVDPLLERWLATQGKLNNLYERAYMMGLKWKMSGEVEKNLSERVTTWKWKKIALSKDMWASSQQEPSNYAQSPSVPSLHGSKRKRSEPSGNSSSSSSKKFKPSTEKDAIVGSTNGNSGGGRVGWGIELVKSFANKP